MAKKTNMKVKGVSFNLEDDFQKRMFDFIEEKTNFSSYVKRLIQRDMEGVIVQEKRPLVIHQEPSIKPDASSFI